MNLAGTQARSEQVFPSHRKQLDEKWLEQAWASPVRNILGSMQEANAQAALPSPIVKHAASKILLSVHRKAERGVPVDTKRNRPFG